MTNSYLSYSSHKRRNIYTKLPETPVLHFELLISLFRIFFLPNSVARRMDLSRISCLMPDKRSKLWLCYKYIYISIGKLLLDLWAGGNHYSINELEYFVQKHEKEQLKAGRDWYFTNLFYSFEVWLHRSSEWLPWAILIELTAYRFPHVIEFSNMAHFKAIWLT